MFPPEPTTLEAATPLFHVALTQLTQYNKLCNLCQNYLPVEERQIALTCLTTGSLTESLSKNRACRPVAHMLLIHAQRSRTANSSLEVIKFHQVSSRRVVVSRLLGFLVSIHASTVGNATVIVVTCSSTRVLLWSLYSASAPSRRRALSPRLARQMFLKRCIRGREEVRERREEEDRAASRS